MLRPLRTCVCALVGLLGTLEACSASSDVEGRSPHEQASSGAPSPGPGAVENGSTLDGAVSPSRDSGPAPSGTPVAQHGALHVEGAKIVDKNGAAYAPRGMSLFWSQWGGAFWNASAIATLGDDWHASIVRAAMGVDSGGYLQDPAREKARVRTVVDAAIARGLYVIIDWHDHDAHLHAEQAKTFFHEMAAAYGGSPNVLFEVWNEPVEVPWSTVKSYAATVISEIRGQGAENLVIVGSPHWSQDVDVAAADPLGDPNVAYAVHFYANTPAHQEPLRAKASAALAAGRALFATEWGTSSADGNGSINEAESQKWLAFLAERGIGWCNWSLFDKPEAASALVPNAAPSGPWPDDALTPSGKFVKAALAKP